MAEDESTKEKYLRKLQEGVKAEEKDLGKEFFVENEGMFWGLSETRPYMRVKAMYAAVLLNLDSFMEQLDNMKKCFP